MHVWRQTARRNNDAKCYISASPTSLKNLRSMSLSAYLQKVLPSFSGQQRVKLWCPTLVAEPYGKSNELFRPLHSHPCAVTRTHSCLTCNFEPSPQIEPTRSWGAAVSRAQCAGQCHCPACDCRRQCAPAWKASRRLETGPLHGCMPLQGACNVTLACRNMPCRPDAAHASLGAEHEQPAAM